MRHRFLLLLLLISLSFVSNAKTSVYVITTFPSNRAVYTVWGHTALLVSTDSTSVVYNYGVFDFSDDFVYKFLAGETDYCLETDRPQNTTEEIIWKNCYAYLQELNLTDEEAEKVRIALVENTKPENKYYRYKFFSDNCATRPRRLLERCMGGITYVPAGNTESYRDKIHALCSSTPWLRLGIDLSLGSGADAVIPDSMVSFLPVELMAQFDSASIVDQGGEQRPMVRKKAQLWKPQSRAFKDDSFFTTPLAVGLLLLLLSLVSLFFAWRSVCKAYVRVYGTILFLAMGLAGVLIFFLTFFSTHECTFPNFNLMWVNPLHLVVAGIVAVGARNRFSKVVIGLDMLFCVGYVLLIAMLPQSTCAEFILFAMSLIISGLSYTMVYKKSFFAKFDKKTLSDKQRIK
ncbi:MAG: DUF4105 domain-containing protein [Paludibacteraceae bacterium]|nr:DUF4105 domain-containing protein [Paludibacteraceae bacterium]